MSTNEVYRITLNLNNTDCKIKNKLKDKAKICIFVGKLITFNYHGDYIFKVLKLEKNKIFLRMAMDFYKPSNKLIIKIEWIEKIEKLSKEEIMSIVI